MSPEPEREAAVSRWTTVVCAGALIAQLAFAVSGPFFEEFRLAWTVAKPNHSEWGATE
ncbi:MAG: hypothetical protein ABSF50_15415 [Burkholderiaceae bacterium]|jgi:hypothetical protein